MNRKKFLDKPSALAGMMAPFAKGGRLYLVTDIPGDISHSEFLISLAFSPCSSLNPFQDLGIGESIIFSPLSEDTTNLESQVRVVFDEFKDRFAVEAVDIKADVEEGEASATVEFEYTPFGIHDVMRDVRLRKAGGAKV